jgi:hypothetical protein
VTRRDELLALAERVEALMGPDREVLATVWWLAGPGKSEWPNYADLPAVEACGKIFGRHPKYPVEWSHVNYSGPKYLTSLDAAMSLVLEGWQGDGLKWWEGEASSCDLVATSLEGDRWTCTGVMPRVSACAATPALALTAAALRALAEQEQ